MTERLFRLLVLVLSLAEATSATTSFAQQNCAEDMRPLAQDRNRQLQMVNDFAKAARGKPLDPAEFCAKSAGLIRAESALIAYMEKNKDLCSFSDEAINQLKEHHDKNVGFNTKACTVAAQTNGAPSRGLESNTFAPGTTTAQAGTSDVNVSEYMAHCSTTRDNDRIKYCTLIIELGRKKGHSGLAVNEIYSAILNRAGAYIETGQLDLAIQDIDLSIRTLPNSFIGYALRSQLFLRLGRQAQAAADCTKAWQLNPVGSAKLNVCRP
jgi:tetratricopeptide (TPR) repeat protein